MRKLDSINNLGALYKAQGRFSDAKSMYDRALEGYEKVLGPEHTSTLNTVYNLSVLYVEQSRLSDAEAMPRLPLAVTFGVFLTTHTRVTK
jgi:tetratricopeptide (TPR) repeat protein